MAGKKAYVAILCLLCAARADVTWNTAAQTKKDAQMPNQSIKVKTELVEMRAVVTDRQARSIKNLRREDFELLVNKQARTIEVFSFVGGEDKPLLTSGNDPSAVPKSLVAPIAEMPARTVVLFVDTLHLSISSLIRTKEVLRRFVQERLTARDLVALVSSGGTLGLAQQFSRDRQLLSYGIEKITPGPVSRKSLFTPFLAASIESGDAGALGLGIDLMRIEGAIPGSSNSGTRSDDVRGLENIVRFRAAEILAESSYLSKATLLTLKEVADRMTSMPGQRMIVFFSDGFSLRERGGGFQTDDLEAAIGSAVHSGVTVYSIDPQGLRPPELADVSTSYVAWNPRLDTFMSSARMDEQNGIRALAADTGGEAYLSTNDMEGVLAKALDANREYYVVGYYRDDKVDGRRYLPYTLRVKNHPEYLIRTQKGYFAPDVAEAKQAEAEKSPQQRMVKAIHSPLPVTALEVSACADYIEMGDDKQVSLTIWLDGQNLQYRAVNQQSVCELEVVSLIYDSNGKQVHGFSDLVQGSLTPEQLALATCNGHRFFRRLALKPGMYQARVGVREKATDRIGTATAWIEVPDLTRTRFAVSNLILVDAPLVANNVATNRMHPSIGMSRIMQGVRWYSDSQSCPYLFRVQKGARSEREHSLEFQMEILHLGKTVVRSEWLPVSIGAKDAKGITVKGSLNLAGLDSGLYELRVTLQDPQSKRTIERSSVFAIEARPADLPRMVNEFLRAVNSSKIANC
jgi:VWFA-related protein